MIVVVSIGRRTSKTPRGPEPRDKHTTLYSHMLRGGGKQRTKCEQRRLKVIVSRIARLLEF
jgi:hypothetical protein